MNPHFPGGRLQRAAACIVVDFCYSDSWYDFSSGPLALIGDRRRGRRYRCAIGTGNSGARLFVMDHMTVGE